MEVLGLESVLPSSYPVELDTRGTREAWRAGPEAASRCSRLSHFVLCIKANWPAGDTSGNHIEINGEGREAVSALLAKLIVILTEPGKKLEWVK
jgi:hypothetical protein